MGDFLGLEPILWNDFPEEIHVVALDRKGVQLAIGLSDGSVWLRDLDTGVVRARLPQHRCPITGLAFAPDGMQLVVADGDGRALVWEADTNGEWTLARTITAEPAFAGLIPAAVFPFLVPQFVSSTLRPSYPDPAPQGIAISPDGKQLCTCVNSSALPGTIALWNLADGTRTACSFSVPRSEHCGLLAFSPDGKYLAAGYLRSHAEGSESYGVRVWHRDTGQLEQDLSPDVPYMRSLCFSPDGKFLACSGNGVALFDTKTFQLEPIARPANGKSVWSLAFSPDSKWIAWVENEQYGSGNSTVHVWDVANGRGVPFPPVRLANESHSIAFHPKSKHLIFVADTGVAEAWDVTTGQKVFSFAAGKSEKRNGIAFLGGSMALSPDGALLACNHGILVTIWDTASRQLLLKSPEQQSSVTSLAWSPKRELLAVGSLDGGLVIWNLPKIKAQLDTVGLGW